MAVETPTIGPARTEAQYQQVRELMAEFIAWDSSVVEQMGMDRQALLDFYYSGGEEAFPGVYAPPEGCLLVAEHVGKVVGSAAFHKMSADTCEMKRLYVTPAARGLHLGQRLVATLIEKAREAGYRRMLLETTTFMTKAQELYASFGFRGCEPYYDVPAIYVPLSVFMELSLGPAS
jgi:putative acetyltransferase